jgi:hypothetical protein
LSIAEYCRQQSLTAIQFYSWKRTILERDQEIASKPLVGKEAEQPAFIPVVIQPPVVPPRSETPIEIILPGQQTIRVRTGCDQQLLAEIVRLLGESSC